MAVPLPGVRKGEQKSPACPPPTALVALLLPPWGCNEGPACFYIRTFFWNLECLGCTRGRGSRAFAPQDRCWGHAGPRQTIPVTMSQKAGAPFCRLSLDQSDPPRLGRDRWARRAVCWPADTLKLVLSDLCPDAQLHEATALNDRGLWGLERQLASYRAALCRSPWPPSGSTVDLRAGLSVHSQVSPIIFPPQAI